jgi:hypothetical protein
VRLGPLSSSSRSAACSSTFMVREFMPTPKASCAGQRGPDGEVLWSRRG